MVLSRRPLALALLVVLAACAPFLFADETPKVAGTDVPSPKRIKTVLPVYPPDAQAQGVRGIVILDIVIDTQGKVSSAEVVRSVPGLDEAALEAVKSWEYEVTKVDGKPVAVRLSVPITFTLKPPVVTHDKGIPDLEQGIAPAYPAEFKQKGATVTAQVALDTQGRVADALITSGDSPWSELVLRALRSWKFPATEQAGTLAFKLEVRFVAGSATAPPQVEIRLTDPRRNSASAQTASSSPAPPAAPAAAPEPSPSPAVAAETTAPPSPAPPPPAPSSPTEPQKGSSGAGELATAPPPANPPPHPASAGAAQPAIEMVPEPVPPRPVDAVAPENGVSSIRDITLSSGIPDLIKGRRPVPPPFARINGVMGSVEVHFAVSPGGATSIQAVDGPDLLKPAAQDAVTSWTFRRTSPERLHLVAVFDYRSDSATAKVSVESTPAPAH